MMWIKISMGGYIFRWEHLKKGMKIMKRHEASETPSKGLFDVTAAATQYGASGIKQVM